MKPVVSRTYRSNKDFERDAAKMFRQGYAVSSATTNKGNVLFGHTLLKWVTGFGILTGPSRNRDTISVVYTRTSPASPRSIAPSFLNP